MSALPGLMVNIICVVAALTQLFFILMGFVNPNQLNTDTSELALQEIDFPLDIKICVRPSLNSTILNDFGYNDGSHYMLGLNSDLSHFGWGGHSNTTRGSALASALEVLEAAKLNLTLDIIKNISIYTHDDKLLFLDADLTRINPVHDCHILNLKADTTDVKQVHITFHEVPENTSVELKLQSKGLTSHRELQESS